MPRARGAATISSVFVSPFVTARSNRLASAVRKARSERSCQLVCSMALRAVPTD
jgi:hypothetical protein